VLYSTLLYSTLLYYTVFLTLPPILTFTDTYYSHLHLHLHLHLNLHLNLHLHLNSQILINIGRGKLIDESALYSILKSNSWVITSTLHFQEGIGIGISGIDTVPVPVPVPKGKLNGEDVGSVDSVDGVREVLEHRKVKGIRAAAIDTWTVEPLPSSSPFWELPNCFVTSHNAGE
jgi:hypothetical protein